MTNIGIVNESKLGIVNPSTPRKINSTPIPRALDIISPQLAFPLKIPTHKTKERVTNIGIDSESKPDIGNLLTPKKVNSVTNPTVLQITKLHINRPKKANKKKINKTENITEGMRSPKLSIPFKAKVS